MPHTERYVVTEGHLGQVWTGRVERIRFHRSGERGSVSVMGPSLIVYRRDHCPYCWNLERALIAAGVEYDRRDIHIDPDAAAFVRSVNGGSETVPTVVLGNGEVRTNPKPKDLLRELGIEPNNWRNRVSRRDH